MIKLIGRTIEKIGTKQINKTEMPLVGSVYFVFDRPSEHLYISLGQRLTLKSARKAAGGEETKCVTTA